MCLITHLIVIPENCFKSLTHTHRDTRRGHTRRAELNYSLSRPVPHSDPWLCNSAKRPLSPFASYFYPTFSVPSFPKGEKAVQPESCAQ